MLQYDYSDGLHRLALSINTLVDAHRANALTNQHPALLSYKSELLVPGYPHFGAMGTWAITAVESMVGTHDEYDESYMDAWDVYHGNPVGSWR